MQITGKLMQHWGMEQCPSAGCCAAGIPATIQYSLRCLWLHALAERVDVCGRGGRPESLGAVDNALAQGAEAHTLHSQAGVQKSAP